MGLARLSAASPFPSSLSPVSSNWESPIIRLSTAALFSGLTSAESRDILLSGRVRSYLPHDIVFSQGHPASTLFLIESGSVKLSQVSPEGNEVILWVNGRGESIGIQAECPAQTYSCTAKVVKRCRAVSWDQAKITALLREHQQLGRNLNRILAQRLQELEIRFREVATERVAHRLAMTLLRLQDRIGKPCEGGIEIALSREELAQMTGTTLFTISRLLSRWGEDGIITPRREAVIVRQPQALEEIGSCDL